MTARDNGYLKWEDNESGQVKFGMVLKTEPSRTCD